MLLCGFRSVLGGWEPRLWILCLGWRSRGRGGGRTAVVSAPCGSGEGKAQHPKVPSAWKLIYAERCVSGVEPGAPETGRHPHVAVPEECRAVITIMMWSPRWL